MFIAFVPRSPNRPLSLVSKLLRFPIFRERIGMDEDIVCSPRGVKFADNP